MIMRLAQRGWQFLCLHPDRGSSCRGPAGQFALTGCNGWDRYLGPRTLTTERSDSPKTSQSESSCFDTNSPMRFRKAIYFRSKL